MLKVKKDPELDAEVERKTQKLMFKVKERPETWFWKWKKDPKLDAESEIKTQNLNVKLKKDPKPDAAKSEKKDLMQNLNLTILASQKAVKSF